MFFALYLRDLGLLLGLVMQVARKSKLNPDFDLSPSFKVVA